MRRPVAIVILILFGLGPRVSEAEATEALARSPGEIIHPEVIEMPEQPPGVPARSLASEAGGGLVPPSGDIARIGGFW